MFKHNSQGNRNLGVINLKTYKANNGITKVYALGYKTALDCEPNIWYI